MTELLTEPRRKALQDVAAGNVYNDYRNPHEPVWKLAGVWPFSQKPYNWLYEHGYIRVANRSQRAELTPAGRAALGVKEEER